jgi:hypothetical protein
MVSWRKPFPWVAGVAIGGLQIGVGISQGNGIASSIFLGVLGGTVAFWVVRFVNRLWCKYFLPAELQMLGIEPAQLELEHKVEPVTNVARKVYWVYFVCLLVFGFVFYIGLAYHFLGVWYIPLAIAFSLLSTWFLWRRWKKIRSRDRK